MCVVAYVDSRMAVPPDLVELAGFKYAAPFYLMHQMYFAFLIESWSVISVSIISVISYLHFAIWVKHEYIFAVMPLMLIEMILSANGILLIYRLLFLSPFLMVNVYL